MSAVNGARALLAYLDSLIADYPGGIPQAAQSAIAGSAADQDTTKAPEKNREQPFVCRAFGRGTGPFVLAYESNSAEHAAIDALIRAIVERGLSVPYDEQGYIELATTSRAGSPANSTKISADLAARRETRFILLGTQAARTILPLLAAGSAAEPPSATAAFGAVQNCRQGCFMITHEIGKVARDEQSKREFWTHLKAIAQAAAQGSSPSAR